MKSRSKNSSIHDTALPISFGGHFTPIICMILAGLIFMSALIRPQMMTDARLLVTDIVSPILSGITKPFQSLSNTIGGVSGMAALRAENAQLHAENERLRQWYQTALMLQAENQSLQKLLNLKSEPEQKFITARVISDAGNTFVKTLLLNLGANDNIQKNQAVLAGEGLIGRIIESGKKSSRILLMTDINSRIPVIIEGTSQKAVMAGNNSDTPVLKHFALDANVIDGARVVTSGDGGVFPVGLPIGRIAKDNKGKYVVKTFAEMSKVSHVRVLKTPFNGNLILKNQDLQ